MAIPSEQNRQKNSPKECTQNTVSYCQKYTPAFFGDFAHWELYLNKQKQIS